MAQEAREAHRLGEEKGVPPTHPGVPRVSHFYGIVIEMYFSDHPPPHFHAIYAEHGALIEIESGALIEGSIPPRALRLVRQWARLHRDELMANWRRARAGQTTKRIEPLR
jgi:uncharacterized protein DUF4160